MERDMSSATALVPQFVRPPLGGELKRAPLVRPLVERGL